MNDISDKHRKYFGKTECLYSRQIRLKVNKPFVSIFNKSRPIVQENFDLLTQRKHNFNFSSMYFDMKHHFFTEYL